MKKPKNPLIFSKSFHRGKNGFCLYSPHGFSIDGVRWATAHQFLMAQRYAGTPLAEAIRLTPSITEADKLVRASGQPVRADWAKVEDKLLYMALLAKHRSHPKLRAGLLATGKRWLIEQPSIVEIQNRISRNQLGGVLMRVRTSLCRSEAQKRRKTPGSLPGNPAAPSPPARRMRPSVHDPAEQVNRGGTAPVSQTTSRHHIPVSQTIRLGHTLVSQVSRVRPPSVHPPQAAPE